jgi:4-amino-4-deoxy-L-arabinose transferase-like glycosyltransferase
VLVALLGLVALVLLVAAHRLGLATGTETRYAEVAREMAESGDFVVPRFNGAPHLEKPPGAYWAVAAAFLVAGANDVAAHVPSLLAAALTLLLVAGAARRLAPPGEPDPRRRGRGAALVLATMPAFVLQAYTVSADAWLVLATTAAGVGLLEGDRAGGRPARRWTLLLHAGLGLGMLAKGPLAIGLVLGAALVVAALRRDARCLRPFVDPLGLVVLLATSLPWYLVANERLPGLLDLYVRRRLLGGLAGSAEFHDNGPHVVWLPVLLGTLPWIGALPGALATIRRREGGLLRSPACVATALALAAPLLFTASPSRLPSYASPAVPWIALLVAHGTPPPLEGPDPAGPLRRRGLLAGTLVLALIVLALPLLDLRRGFDAAVTPPLLGLGLAAVACAFLPRPPRTDPSLAWRAAGVALLHLLTLATLLPARPDVLGAERPLWRAVEGRREPGDAVGALLKRNGDWGLFPFYSREPVAFFGYRSVLHLEPPDVLAPDRFLPREAVGPWLRSPKRRWLLVHAREDLTALGAPVHVVATGGRHRVVTNLPLE